jgi:hypothetical protein
LALKKREEHTKQSKTRKKHAHKRRGTQNTRLIKMNSGNVRQDLERSVKEGKSVETDTRNQMKAARTKYDVSGRLG